MVPLSDSAPSRARTLSSSSMRVRRQAPPRRMFGCNLSSVAATPGSAAVMLASMSACASDGASRCACPRRARGRGPHRSAARSRREHPPRSASKARRSGSREAIRDRVGRRDLRRTDWRRLKDGLSPIRRLADPRCGRSRGRCPRECLAGASARVGGKSAHATGVHPAVARIAAPPRSLVLNARRRRESVARARSRRGASRPAANAPPGNSAARPEEPPPRCRRANRAPERRR